jgi:hypothetical protein
MNEASHLGGSAVRSCASCPAHRTWCFSGKARISECAAAQARNRIHSDRR